ncbi:MAG: uridine kinase [Ruminococcaceae bacterium]|nr:uridine kinase [Oscillospiraceae bacterium]
MKNLIDEVEKLLLEKSNPVIAIDGPCASGKTTLARPLSERYSFQVIQTDSFFLPPEMRNKERLSQPGGNVHYERFNNEVAHGIKSGSEFVYGIYNCHTGIQTDSRPVSPLKPIIIEGSYSLHPEIQVAYDLKIFVEADYETRLCRIFERNGKESLEIFKSKWIPLEDRYFKEYSIKEKCDIKIKTDR